MNHSELLDQIKQHAVSYGDFELSSGQKSNYYIDLRKITLDSMCLESIVFQMMATAPIDVDIVSREPNIDAIGGPTLGADPIVGGYLAIMGREEIPCRGFLVRKEKKAHGSKKCIEGNLKKGDNVLLVEDVITTGGSVLQAAEAVEDFGAKVCMIFAVLDRRKTPSSKLGEYNFYSLYSANLDLEDQA